MFNLTARNQAIQVMKLKSYLELDPSKRAAWCYIVDARFTKHDLKNLKVDKGRLVGWACKTGLPRMSEFKFGCTGFDGLGLHGLGLVLVYTKYIHCK
jgi:hypothetical protein